MQKTELARERKDVVEPGWETVRRVVDDMKRHCLGHEGMEDSPVARWARELREALGGNGRDRAADVSVSAYDLLPQEERDAIAWVREHGGLEEVEAHWSGRVPLTSVKRMVALHKAKRERLKAHALGLERKCAERGETIRELSGKAAKQSDEIRVMRDVIVETCARLGVEGTGSTVDDAQVIWREISRRLMPKGMEWPRYEDGEPVRPGDRLLDKGGDWFEAASFVFTCDWWSVRGYQTEGFGDLNDKTRRKLEGMAYGTCVRRPAPKVLDADGVEVEVGDDLYTVEGMLKFHVSHVDRANGKIATDAMFAIDKWADPSLFTHRAPVLAADGEPLEVGQTVWHEDGTELRVLGFEHEEDGEIMVSVECVDGPSNWSSVRNLSVTHHRLRAADDRPFTSGQTVYDVDSGIEYRVLGIHIDEENPVRVMRTDCSHLAKAAKPNTLTHRRPVLDAGGVPIKRGDTVWRVSGGEAAEVAYTIDADASHPDEVVLKGYEDDWPMNADKLTHTKPEIDSWERIEEDARGLDSGVDRELFTHTHEDIVRRCRALAERERSE